MNQQLLHIILNSILPLLYFWPKPVRTDLEGRVQLNGQPNSGFCMREIPCLNPAASKG